MRIFDKICELVRAGLVLCFLLFIFGMVGLFLFYIPIHFVLKYW